MSVCVWGRKRKREGEREKAAHIKTMPEKIENNKRENIAAAKFIVFCCCFQACRYVPMKKKNIFLPLLILLLFSSFYAFLALIRWWLKCSSSLNYFFFSGVSVCECVCVAFYDHFFVLMPISGNSDLNCPLHTQSCVSVQQYNCVLAFLTSLPHFAIIFILVSGFTRPRPVKQKKNVV